LVQKPKDGVSSERIIFQREWAKLASCQFEDVFVAERILANSASARSGGDLIAQSPEIWLEAFFESKVNKIGRLVTDEGASTRRKSRASQNADNSAE
jgi:hypothetical protein